MKPPSGEIVVEPGESLYERLCSALKDSEIEGSYILVHVALPFGTDYDTYILRTPDTKTFWHEILGGEESENISGEMEVLYIGGENAVKLFPGEGGLFDYTVELHMKGSYIVEIGRPFYREARIMSGDAVRKFLSKYGPTKMGI
jgi:hypothetical protein